MSCIALSAAPSLPERFTRLIEGLCQVIAARAGRERALAPLLMQLWPRLRRMDARFQALVARLRAGLASPALRPASSRPASSRPPSSHAAASHPAGRPQTAPSAATPPPPSMPNNFAWLILLMQETAFYRANLESLLADPEMPALLAAEPRLGRIFRPLCHMLAIRPGPLLALPPRRLAAASTPLGPPQPGPRPVGQPQHRQPPQEPRQPGEHADPRHPSAALALLPPKIREPEHG